MQFITIDSAKDFLKKTKSFEVNSESYQGSLINYVLQIWTLLTHGPSPCPKINISLPHPAPIILFKIIY